MPDSDTTLKLLIAESADTVLPMLGATAAVKRWLNVELPKTQNLRVDLLAELTSGHLQHIELQSDNEPEIPFRMLEYGVVIFRSKGKFPLQIVVYVGNDPLRMNNSFRAPGIDFHFAIIDLRTLDGTALLESDRLSDNLLALLMALDDKREAIRRIADRISRLEEARRKDALTRFLLTCGMRKLLAVANEEIQKMPVTLNVMEDPFLANLVMRGREEGRQEGRGEGLTEGLDLGKKELVRLQLAKRFGPLPSWVDERLAACSHKQIDDLAIKILDCPTLNQLFEMQ